MSTKSDEISADIYGISDVVRNCHKIVVVVGRSGTDRLPSGTTTQTLLKEWGTRMWTWPEVLLGPLSKEVTVFTRGLEGYAPQDYTKLQFAYQVWDDAVVARQLLDHYENSLTLSRLELVILALESLKRRVVHGTTKFADGDMSYALMGLLRQRPQVDLEDTAFQAFARLSLANDSDRLLERLVCLLPAFENDPFSQHDNGLNDRNTSQSNTIDRSQPFDNQQEKLRHYWTNFSDYWGAKLWDVEPICQVAGIADNDTVILDGAFGATVHWDQFQRVAIVTRETWSRFLARSLVRSTPGWFFPGVLLAILGSGGHAPNYTASAVIFLLISIPLILLSPILILHIYSGKVWGAQPWLFGIEGHMELSHIEKKIFGFPCERLSWSPHSSSMSRHHVKNDFLPDECEGTNPLLGSEATHPSDTVDETTGERLRIFSIVDTFTM